MSFFKSAPEDPKRRVPPALGDWLQPANHILGVPVPCQLVLANDGGCAVVASEFVAYPTGLRFSIGIRFTYANFDPTRHERVWSGPGAVRYGLELSDGTRVFKHVETSDVWPPVRRPDGYTLMSIGGVGNETYFQIELWLSPLPPDGTLTIVVSWPDVLADEVCGTVDLGSLHRIAASAVVLWPDDRPKPQSEPA
jgi:hypothetical protein